jgi:hypothetical protein
MKVTVVPGIFEDWRNLPFKFDPLYTFYNDEHSALFFVLLFFSAHFTSLTSEIRQQLATTSQNVLPDITNPYYRQANNFASG